MNAGTGRVLPARLRRPVVAPASALPWYGLAIFTFFFVTARLPPLFTELGIYLALLGLVVYPPRPRFPAAAALGSGLSTLDTHVGALCR